MLPITFLKSYLITIQRLAQNIVEHIGLYGGENLYLKNERIYN